MKVRLDEGAFKPVRAHDTDAGIDLCTPSNVFIPRHGSAVIDTGVHVQLPHNTVGMIKSKSVPMTESVLNNMYKAITIACHHWIDGEHDGIVYPVAYIKSVLTGENDDI
jgi:dUTPase